MALAKAGGLCGYELQRTSRCRSRSGSHFHGRELYHPMWYQQGARTMRTRPAARLAVVILVAA
jgi:hypothetical protein